MENLKLKKNKILVIAAHPDDEILGCGGTINKLKNSNTIKIVFLTNGVSARSKNKKKENIRKNECLSLMKYLKLPKPVFFNFPDNALDSIPILRIIKKIENLIKKFKPNIIFTHSDNCLNIDHMIAYRATITACRPILPNIVNLILSFEIPSSTEWKIGRNKFNPNFYIDIKNDLSEKINCLKFYKSELRRLPHSRSLKGIENVAKYRGLECGKIAAEAFEIKRLIFEDENKN